MATKNSKQIKGSDTEGNMYGVAKWYENKFIKFVSLIGAISTIFLLGWKIKGYKNDIDNTLDNIKLKQECNVLLQNEREKCYEFKRQLETKKLEELDNTIKELSKKTSNYER